MARLADYFSRNLRARSVRPASAFSVLLLSAGMLVMATRHGPAGAQDPAAASAPVPAAVAPVAAAVPVTPPLPAPAPVKAPAPAKPAATAAADNWLWKNLSPAQRQALAPLGKEWDGIDLPRRRKWLEIANRFPTLPADEQGRVQERMISWANLSTTERSQARLSYQQAKLLDPGSRQAKWEAYQALAPEQRQELADKAAKKTQAKASNAPKAGKSAAADPKALMDNQIKSNLVPNRASAPLPKAVGPTVVQNKPGATTTLINQSSLPPTHQQGGLPKILAAPDLVDPVTLLPRRAPAERKTDPTPPRS